MIALHDTGLHPPKRVARPHVITEADGTVGRVHQAVERRMVNVLHDRHGDDAFCAHADPARNDERLPFRHGLTIMKKFGGLPV